MAKVLYFDVETTGKSPYKNDIIQLAGIIEIDGTVIEEFDIKMKPIDPNNIDDEALRINRVTREMLESDEFVLPRTGYSELTAIFGKYIDKFDKTDKMVPCGYNVSFDLSFLEQFFRKNGDNFLGSWIDRRMTKDPLPVVRYLKSIDIPAFDSLLDNKTNLGTICEAMGIDLGENAHEAMADVRATRAVIKNLDKGLRYIELKGGEE